MSKDVILNDIYPYVSNKIKVNMSKFKKLMSEFMQSRSVQLYDFCPCDRLFFTYSDIEEFYTLMGISEQEVVNKLSKVYYWNHPNFNPAAAKDPFTIAVLCMIRYFFKSKMNKELELSMIYLSFSGKFYPSIHYGLFPKFPPSEYRHIMEYVVNNKLSNKYDLKREGSVFGTVKSICNTWLKSYNSRLNSFEDEDVVYIIQQLHNRIKSFMKNIAEVYYETYNDKDSYLTYDSDSLEDSTFRLVDNDSMKMERIVQITLQNINNKSVNYQICKSASNANVKTDELKGIIELIIDDKKEAGNIQELLRIIVTEYFLQSKTKDVRDIDFITKSLSTKSNTKNPNIIRQKEIIENWLTENSPSYLRRRSREATKNNYFRAILTYFVLCIHIYNK